MVILVRNDFTEMSLNLRLGRRLIIKKIVGGKYGRSKETVAVFFAQLHLELLSNELP